MYYFELTQSRKNPYLVSGFDVHNPQGKVLYFETHPSMMNWLKWGSYKILQKNQIEGINSKAYDVEQPGPKTSNAV